MLIFHSVQQWISLQFLAKYYFGQLEFKCDILPPMVYLDGMQVQWLWFFIFPMNHSFCLIALGQYIVTITNLQWFSSFCFLMIGKRWIFFFLKKKQKLPNFKGSTSQFAEANFNVLPNSHTFSGCLSVSRCINSRTKVLFIFI